MKLQEVKGKTVHFAEAKFGVVLSTRIYSPEVTRAVRALGGRDKCKEIAIHWNKVVACSSWWNSMEQGNFGFLGKRSIGNWNRVVFVRPFLLQNEYRRVLERRGKKQFLF